LVDVFVDVTGVASFSTTLDSSSSNEHIHEFEFDFDESWFGTLPIDGSKAVTVVAVVDITFANTDGRKL
jgi:hypothetical protein